MTSRRACKTPVTRHPSVERTLDVVVDALFHIIIRGNQTMASIQQLKDAITFEGAEVKTRLDELEATVQALRDQIAAGGTITEAQLDEVLVAVQGIFVPVAPAPAPGTGLPDEQ